MNAHGYGIVQVLAEDRLNRRYNTWRPRRRLQGPAVSITPSCVLQPMISYSIHAWQIAAALLLVVFYTVLKQFTGRRGRKLPPGPRPVPLLGNVHQLPLQYQQRAFAQWGRVYGDLIYARLFQKPALVLNSVQVAQDLMDKRSSKYSRRIYKERYNYLAADSLFYPGRELIGPTSSCSQSS